MNEIVDPSIPLLPSAQPYIIDTEVNYATWYYLRTPPGVEKIYIVRSDGKDTDQYYSGIDLKAQGAFDTEQGIRFSYLGDGDEYIITTEYGVPYLRPTWIFRLTGREIIHFAPPPNMPGGF